MERRRFDPLIWPTRLALGALGAALVLNTLALVSDVSYHDLIHRLVNGGDVSLADAQAADDRQFRIADAELAVFALTALAFVVWFYRAYENLRALGVLSLRWGTGWAVGGWFVPFLNFVRPKIDRERQLARKLTRPPTAARPADGTRTLVAPPVVGAFSRGRNLRAGGGAGVQQCADPRRARGRRQRPDCQ